MVPVECGWVERWPDQKSSACDNANNANQAIKRDTDGITLSRAMASTPSTGRRSACMLHDMIIESFMLSLYIFGYSHRLLLRHKNHPIRWLLMVISLSNVQSNIVMIDTKSSPISTIPIHPCSPLHPLSLSLFLSKLA